MGLHRARARERGADEAQTHRLELAGWKLSRCVAGPEAVKVARDDRKPGDLRVANEIVDLAALGPGTAVIAAAQSRERTGRPRLLRQARGQILRVGARLERALRVPPDLPRRRRALQLVLEPGLLLGSKNGLRRRVLLRVCDVPVFELELRGRMAPVVSASPVEHLRDVLGEHAVEVPPVAKLAERVVAERVGAAIAVLIGDDQVEVLAPAQRPIAFQTVDRYEVVRLDAEAVVVELLDRNVLDGRRPELLERSAWRSDARGKIFEPGLIGGDLHALARLHERAGLDDALPAPPGKFVVVPHGDERPARARVLKVGVVEIALVDGAITVERQRNVEIADLVSVGNPRDLVD